MTTYSHERTFCNTFTFTVILTYFGTKNNRNANNFLDTFQNENSVDLRSSSGVQCYMAFRLPGR